MGYQQDLANGRVGVTVQSRSGRNLPPHRPNNLRPPSSHRSAQTGSFNTADRQNLAPRTWNSITDATVLFQKYSRRKGRATVDYADIRGRRIESMILFRKLELVERSGFGASQRALLNKRQQGRSYRELEMEEQ